MVVRFGVVYNKADGDNIQKGRRCRVPKIIADMKVQFVCAGDKGVIGRNGAVCPSVFVGVKFVHGNPLAVLIQTKSGYFYPAAGAATGGVKYMRS